MLSETRPTLLAIATVTSRWHQNLTLIPPRLGCRPHARTELFYPSPSGCRLSPDGCELSFLDFNPPSTRGLQTCHCYFLSAFCFARSPPPPGTRRWAAFALAQLQGYPKASTASVLFKRVLKKKEKEKKTKQNKQTKRQQQKNLKK